MAKQTLGQGDSNVVVRNQVVYGALPQDVIDRMGDTTLALQTTEQNVLPAINELKSNLIKIGFATGTATNVAVGANASTTITTIPSDQNVLAIIPIYFAPSTHWNSVFVVSGINVSTKTISYSAVGSGGAQSWDLGFCYLYTD